MVDHKDMVAAFYRACRSGDKQLAEQIIYVMHDSCPYEHEECLKSMFCPSCWFYKSNGGVDPTSAANIT